MRVNIYELFQLVLLSLKTSNCKTCFGDFAKEENKKLKIMRVRKKITKLILLNIFFENVFNSDEMMSNVFYRAALHLMTLLVEILHF